MSPEPCLHIDDIDVFYIHTAQTLNWKVAHYNLTISDMHSWITRCYLSKYNRDIIEIKKHLHTQYVAILLTHYEN